MFLMELDFGLMFLDLLDTNSLVNPPEVDGGAEGGQQVPLQHAGSHTLPTGRDLAGCS